MEIATQKVDKLQKQFYEISMIWTIQYDKKINFYEYFTHFLTKINNSVMNNSAQVAH